MSSASDRGLLIGEEEVVALLGDRQFNPEVLRGEGSVSVWLPELEVSTIYTIAADGGTSERILERSGTLLGDGPRRFPPPPPPPPEG